MYAVVSTGGKQLRVSKDDVVAVEKLAANVGDTVVFDVLMVADDDVVSISPDQLATAKVSAEVIEHFKGEKTIVFKFKKRKGYKTLRGHRQNLTRVRITEIALEEKKKPARKTSSAKKVETTEAEVSEQATEVGAVEKAEESA